MTPCELWLEFEAAERRRQAVLDRQLSVEWHGLRMYFEAMSKQYLQPLKHYLDQAKPKRSRPSLVEQKSDLAMISQQYGIRMGPWSDIRIHRG